MMERLLNLLPALLLVLVALNQVRLATTEALSPWSGGGFGMFASVDSPPSRHLQVYVQNEDVRKEIAFPPVMADQALRARALPSEQHLTALAAAVVPMEAGAAFDWHEIIVEVWSTHYDPVTLQPRRELLRRQRFDYSAF